MFSNLMSNPYAWAFLSLCTVASLIFGVFTWLKGRTKKEFSYVAATYPIIESGHSSIPKVKIHFDGEEVTNLTISKFIIWNSGNEVLNGSDIVPTRELKVEIPAEQNILEAQIIAQTEETNCFAIKESTSGYVKMTFDYADIQDGCVLQLLHTGDFDDLKISCKIKGGLDLRELNQRIAPPKVLKKIKAKHRKVVLFLPLLIVTAAANVMNLVLLLSLVSPAVNKIMHQPVPPTQQVTMVTILTAMTCLNDWLTFKIARLLFRFSVPKKLKSHINTEYVDLFHQE